MASEMDNIFDFCLIDDGISIQKSFENRNFDFSNDCEGILKAINGKSTKQIDGQISRGYGLNNISSLINCSGGCVLIASRNGMVSIGNNNVYNKSIKDKCIKGTLIAFRLNLKYEFEDFYDLIDGHHLFKVN